MLTVPSRSIAEQERRRLHSGVVEDWQKILDFAVDRKLIEARRSDLLRRALIERFETDGEIDSEVIQYYFRALGAIREGTGTAARFVQMLGNALLARASDSQNRTIAIPVYRRDAGGVPIPQARAEDCLRLERDEVADEDLSSDGVLRDALDRSWVDRTGPMPLKGSTLAVDFEVEKYNTAISGLAGFSVDLRAARTDPFVRKPMADRYADALALLESADADVYGEVRTMTRFVVPVLGDEFVGGSDITLHGASFLNLREEWSDLCIADHLVHECAHQLLHAAQETQPLIRNRNQMGQPSPIRSDERPLYGSYHATFVFLRLVQMLTSLHRSAPPGVDLGELEVRLHRHLLGLLQGLGVLADHADFTEKGAAEFDSWIEIAAATVRDFGSPNLELAASLDWDYGKADLSLPLLRVQ